METTGLYAVKGWDETFECAQSRKVADLRWFQMPIALDSDGFVDLMDEDHGPASYGVWCAILQLAARGKTRGVLLKRPGVPHTPRTVAKRIRMPESVVATAWDTLIEIGWLVEVDATELFKSRYHSDTTEVIDDREQGGSHVGADCASLTVPTLPTEPRETRASALPAHGRSLSRSPQEAGEKDPKPPPVDAMVEAYHELVADGTRWPRCELPPRAALNAGWAAVGRDLSAWRSHLTAIRASAWLRDRIEARIGIGWACDPANIAGVANGEHEDRARGSPAPTTVDRDRDARRIAEREARDRERLAIEDAEAADPDRVDALLAKHGWAAKDDGAREVRA